MALIGISGNLSFENNSASPRAFVSDAYVSSVTRSAGVPFILPICYDEDITRQMISHIDGVILSGGVDIHPFLFGEEPHPNIGVISQERDIADFNILKFAREFNKPVLGICRGLQVINVFFGGTLIQDIPSQTTSHIKHDQSARTYVATHKINILRGTILHEILGDEALVNSFHHQSIARVANGFNATASANDGIVEAIEHNGEQFIVGVQWHPELLSEGMPTMQTIFDKFIEVCTNKK